MAKELSNQKLNLFEQIRQTDENGNEYWLARQLAKAKEACENSGQMAENHIVETNEMVVIK